jgi:peptidoglycan/xylan/chitin deacetylase (PgdA/CDA1 family)
MGKLGVFLLFIVGISAVAGGLHLPENRLYIPKVDTGYEQYNTPSIHFSSKYVLTFDDGPHPVHTAQILDILKKYKVKATFFILTEKLNARTLPIFKRILDEGHIASSHNHVHDHNNKIPEKVFKKNIKSSILKLAKYYKLAGHQMNTFYFRFPYAEYGGHKDYHHMNVIKEVSDELFGKNCIHFVFWDIDSGDWIPKLTPEEVFNNIKAHHIGGSYTTYKLGRDANGKRVILKKPAFIQNPTEGGVILQHDIQKRSVKGTELFLRYAKENYIDIIPLKTVDEFSYNDLGCKLI